MKNQSNVTPPKVTNSTARNTDDSEVDNISDKK
jgi:hypothetical protein